MAAVSAALGAWRETVLNELGCPLRTLAVHATTPPRTLNTKLRETLKMEGVH